MRIRLDTLTDGTHRQDWTGQIAGVDLIYPEIPASVQVRATVCRLRELITVRGHVRGRFDRPCDRCLNLAGVALEATLYVVIRQRTVGVRPEEGDQGEVLLTLAPGEQEVDLINQIRDALIVEVPMVVCCSDNCKGLCPKCGADLNRGPCACSEEQDERCATLRVVKRE